jgi:D-threo-aldose 1-dehydrogenase
MNAVCAATMASNVIHIGPMGESTGVRARRGVELTPLALGCAPLGGLFHAVADDDARATVDAAWEAGIRLFDVAPQYGVGRAERRLGAALASRPRAAYILSTKVGRLVVAPGAGDGQDTSHFEDAPAAELAYDYTRDGVRRSLEASLERLGLDRADIVHVHDPDEQLERAIAEAVPALCELRDEGVVRAVGAGMNHAAPLARIVRETDVDCVLLAGRYTLLDHAGALGLLDACAERGVAVIAAGVFNSGVLAGGTTFEYEPASAEVLERARALGAACARHGVPLTAAAMRFPLGHPAVASVLVGARSAGEVRANAAGFAAPVPAALWEELRAAGLLAAGVPVPLAAAPLPRA